MLSRISLFLYLFIGLVSKFSFAQNFSKDELYLLDSLNSVINNKASHDTSKAAAYINLCDLYFTSYVDTLSVFSEKAKIIAEKVLATKQPDVVKKSLKKSLASALNYLGTVNYFQSNMPKATEYFNKSLLIRKELGNKVDITESLNNLGIVYKNLGDIPKALDYYHQSLKVREEIGDKFGVSNSLINIGTIYYSQKDYDKAIEYFLRSLALKKEIGKKQGIATCLNNIANIYNVKGDTEKAKEYFINSIKIYTEIDEKNGIATSLNGLGSVYKKTGDISKALDCLEKSLKILQQINDKKAIAQSLNNIGELYFMQGNLTEAIKYATRSFEIAEELAYPEITKNVSLLLFQIYEKQGKGMEALKMHKLYVLMKDSLNNAETQKATLKTQMQYEFEKKELLTQAEQEKKDAIVTEEKQKQKIILYATIAGLLLVIVFFVLLFNRFKTTQKQKIIIENQKQIVEHQKELVEEKHKEITDSINYAERIQRSFLATKELLDENLNDYFVLFQPKDVVSGDFYWATKLSNGNFALATADSTGHGVPGAIMSLLNITSLESAIKDGYTQPAEILNATRKTIIERLKKDGSAEGGKDGMDCSLTVYDFTQNKLFVTAANNPVWIVRGSEVIEIKPDKMPVGKHDKQDVLFTQYEIDLQSGDVVYTLTDGFPDQFGGESGKKFMSKKLRELLLANANLPMGAQKDLLLTTFKNWVGELEQVDDVCIIGVRV